MLICYSLNEIGIIRTNDGKTAIVDPETFHSLDKATVSGLKERNPIQSVFRNSIAFDCSVEELSHIVNIVCKKENVLLIKSQYEGLTSVMKLLGLHSYIGLVDHFPKVNTCYTFGQNIMTMLSDEKCIVSNANAQMAYKVTYPNKDSVVLKKLTPLQSIPLQTWSDVTCTLKNREPMCAVADNRAVKAVISHVLVWE